MRPGPLGKYQVMGRRFLPGDRNPARQSSAAAMGAAAAEAANCLLFIRKGA
jgi:hypothetical protein